MAQARVLGVASTAVEMQRHVAKTSTPGWALLLMAFLFPVVCFIFVGPLLGLLFAGNAVAAALAYHRWRRLPARQRRKLDFNVALEDPEAFRVQTLVASIEAEEERDELGLVSVAPRGTGRLSPVSDTGIPASEPSGASHGPGPG